MAQKSITFRCSEAQYHRLSQAVQENGKETRTAVLVQALKEFLDFAEQEEVQAMDLFELVAKIEQSGEGPNFEQQA